MQGEGGRSVHKQETQRWRPRDYLAAVALFAGTAGFVWWQNARVAVLWDLGYLLDTSWRIALGQMPYRDFPLVHAPLTFLVQAGLIRLAGRHYIVPVAYAALCGGLATVVGWRVVRHVLRASAQSDAMQWVMALLMAAPLPVLGIYSVYPHPIYDCDCALSILFAMLLLTRIAATGSAAPGRMGLAFAAGVATAAPVFFKQNMGLPFVAAVGGCMLVLLAVEFIRERSPGVVLRSRPACVLAGMGAALLVAVLTIHWTAGLGNYLHWTVQFAAQRRLPGLATMLEVYRQPSFVWTVPVLGAGLALCFTALISRWWARMVAFGLMAAPFVASLVSQLMEDEPDERADILLALWPLVLLAVLVVALYQLRCGVTLRRLIPLIVLAAIHGTLLSQQLWGSTYALWPLLMMLLAFLLSELAEPARPVAIAFAVVVSAAFAIGGGMYAVSLERLSYVQIPDAPMAHASTTALRGMETRGVFLPNLDELVEYTAREIPQSDAIVLLPGEDPFYYATGRIPRFPVTLFDPATDPYSATELLEEAGRRKVEWVIVKRALQINTNPLPEGEETMRRVQQEFALQKRLSGYDIYRRR